MAGQRVPMPCLNSCLEISMARGGLQSFLLSKPLLALTLQSYQYDKAKTFLGWHFNKILSSHEVHLQLTDWLLTGKHYFNLREIIMALWGEHPCWVSLSIFLMHRAQFLAPDPLQGVGTIETPGIALSIAGYQSWAQGKLISFLLGMLRSRDQ